MITRSTWDHRSSVDQNDNDDRFGVMIKGNFATRLEPRGAFWPVPAILTTALIIGGPFLPAPYRNESVVIAAVAGIWAVTFFRHQRHIEDAKFMKELFEYFNDRYNKLNDNLHRALWNYGDFGADEEIAFMDYFNLCAEEWVFRQAGYIYDPVWESWHNGMLQFADDARVQKLWQRERQSKSYYGFKFPVGQTLGVNTNKDGDSPGNGITNGVNSSSPPSALERRRRRLHWLTE